MSYYPPGSGSGYAYSNGQIPYSPLAALYPTYSPTYLSNQGHSASRIASSIASEPSQIPLHYQHNSAEYAAILAQQRSFSQDQYTASRAASSQRYNYPSGLSYGHESHMMQETETQETFSENEQSEPVVPALDGYPVVKEFDQLMERYT